LSGAGTALPPGSLSLIYQRLGSLPDVERDKSRAPVWGWTAALTPLHHPNTDVARHRANRYLLGMKKLILVFILGLVAGALGYRFFKEQYKDEDLRTVARDKVIQGAGTLKEVIQDKISEIKTEDIKEELARTGTVIREKAQKAGAAIADATADARITAAIKGKLLQEPGLSAFKIHVECTQGVVTLSGAVSNHDQIAKVVKLSLDTEGVQKVISTLQVKSS
jgi:osmotically-inducible protein OsmY